MKLICLNIWGGKMYKPLMEFIKKHKATTDIFCFQEVFQSDTNISESSGFKMNILFDLTNTLKNFQGYFVKSVSGYDMVKLVNFEVNLGNAIFVKKYIKTSSYEEIFIHIVDGEIVRRKGYFESSRTLQFIQFKLRDKLLNVYNLHGLWIPDFAGGKKDNKERLLQSEKIIRFIQKYNGEKIMVGDFNLDPETKSLKIIENNLINLIKEYNIPTTRTSLYTRKNKFADYTLVSSGIKVISFEVPNINISDHRPMILEFDF